MATVEDGELSVEDIRIAHDRIRAHVHRTPVVTSTVLTERANAQLFFKCENLQRSGAFKVRGAFNAVLSMSEAALAAGVVTSSSGNQAAALCLAARSRGTTAYVAMPRVALSSKVEAVKRYGGQVVWVESGAGVPSDEEYASTVASIQAKTGAELIHPYNDFRTIAGQGTCALELLEQVEKLDVLLVPVGGGGLLAGMALAAKQLRPEIRVIGCEPQGADDAQRSFRSRQRLPQLHPRTIADGLRTSLGDINFPLIARYVDDIVTVSEQAIVESMRLAWETLKLVIEPSGAVPLAAAFAHPQIVAARRVGMVFSGGNVDLDRLPWMAERA